MLQEERGLWLRSKPITFVDGSNIPVDLSFLDEVLSRMRAPVVREILFHLLVQGTGTTGDSEGEDAYKFFGRIRMRDRGGVFYDLPGSVMRVVEQMEIGACQIDLAQVTSGGAATNYNVKSRVLFDVEKAHRGADTALPLIHLTQGGTVQVTFDTPKNFTVTSAQMHMYALVHDERTRELKSRMTWSERSITAVEDHYVVNGSLRAAIVTSDLPTAEGYTALSGISSIDSKTFQWTDLDPRILVDDYIRKTGGNFATDDEFMAAARNAIALVSPSKGQHIGKMQDLSSFHVDLEDSITGGLMVLCIIEDRIPSLAAEWLGFRTTGAFAQALADRGVVSAKGKAGKAIGLWDAKLQRRLPVQVPGVPS